MIYALDSNIVSYMLKGNVDIKLRYRQAIEGGNDVVIPPIVFYEVQRGLLAGRLNKRLVEFDELCQNALNVEFDILVWQRAAQISALLYQEGRPIEDADILIAAYCLVNDFTLVTNNSRHFERIDGLKIVNWK
jgi:predicted nucleic acid-binding protein